MTHQLTDEQRKLLEDCPRENIMAVLADSENTMLDFCDFGPDETVSVDGWSHALSGAYIPRAAVEAWLAEQDEREAEIERRIGELVNKETGWAIKEFEKYEKVFPFFYLDAGGGPFIGKQTGTIPVPRDRIRAALDAKLAAEADHLRDATQMVHDDQSGDATEMIEPRRYPDEVGEDEGQWFADNSWSGFWTTTKRCAFSADIASYFRVSEWGESLAKIKAEVCAAELNAIWRREEEARRRDIAHGEALEEDKRRSVTISPELRARLEKRARVFLTTTVRNCSFLAQDDRVMNLDDEGMHRSDPQDSTIPCTPAQAKAFLAEKGVKVDE